MKPSQQYDDEGFPVYYDDEPLPECMPELPQYHFDRALFTQTFGKVFTDEELIDIDVTCSMEQHYDEFSLFRVNDEFYILHRKSGVMINWYKHLGRTNTCNRDDFTLEDLEKFLVRLKAELQYYDAI